jgi:Late competence development protein ComFB
MRADFDSIHNHHEHLVFDAVRALAPRFAHLQDPQLLADVACVALNRVPPRYIRHDVDLAFYLTAKEQAAAALVIDEAVQSAFEFVQARQAMRART